MKKYILLLWIVALASGLAAQQDSHYSQYMFNHLAINPSYAGSTENLSGAFIFRKQWMQLDGAPTTQSLTAHTVSNNLRNGYGLSFYNDQIGVTRATSLNLSYAYRILFGDHDTEEIKPALAFGLQGSLTQMSSQLSGVRTTSLIASQSQDPAFMNNTNLWLPNVGVGAFFNTRNFYLGLSAPDLIQNKIIGDNTVPNSDAEAREFRNYFLYTGFITGRSDSPLRFKPSMLLKYVQGAPASVDLNAQFLIRNLIWVGASYRHDDAIVGLIGIQAGKFLHIGYAYDATTSELSTVSNGSHEIMLRFDFKFNRRGMVSPRWF